MTDENTSYLPNNHPVRYLIERAATGQQPSKAELDALDRDDLPPADNLARFRGDVATACRNAARAGAEGNHLHGRQQAESEWSGIAQRMTPGARALDGTGQTDEPLDDIANRIFNNH